MRSFEQKPLFEKMDLSIWVLSFISIILMRYSAFSLPFWGDEAIYLFKSPDNLHLSSFIPFHSFYQTNYGHPPTLSFLSWLTYKAQLPFIPTVRVIYALFSSLMLLGTYKVANQFHDKKTSAAILILVFFTPIVFTQSVMSMGDIPGIALVLLSFYFFLKKEDLYLCLSLVAGLMIRESTIGAVVVLFLLEPEKIRKVKFYLPSIVCFLLFFIGEKLATGDFLTHAYATGSAAFKRDTKFSILNLTTSYVPIKEMCSTTFLFLSTFTPFFFWKSDQKKKKELMTILALAIPYILFFGLYGDTQGRDFIIIIPLGYIALFSFYSSFLKKKYSLPLFSLFLIIPSLLEYQDFVGKLTPRYSEYTEKTKEVLTYLDENPQVKNNLVGDFPFNLILKEKHFGYLNHNEPIKSGSKSYLISNLQMNLKVFKEFPLAEDTASSIFIYNKASH